MDSANGELAIMHTCMRGGRLNKLKERCQYRFPRFAIYTTSHCCTSSTWVQTVARRNDDEVPDLGVLSVATSLDPSDLRVTYQIEYSISRRGESHGKVARCWCPMRP